MLAGTLHFKQPLQFHWHHKQIVTKFVSIFVCGVQGLELFPSLMSLVIRVIQSSGRQGVNARPLVGQPRLCLMRLCAAPALGEAAIFRDTWGFGHDPALLQPLP